MKVVHVRTAAGHIVIFEQLVGCRSYSHSVEWRMLIKYQSYMYERQKQLTLSSAYCGQVYGRKSDPQA